MEDLNKKKEEEKKKKEEIAALFKPVIAQTVAKGRANSFSKSNYRAE